ncbi:hypothetical protein VTH06DRAFT_417 [Thermothelomyces fergusii]
MGWAGILCFQEKPAKRTPPLKKNKYPALLIPHVVLATLCRIAPIVRQPHETNNTAFSNRQRRRCPPAFLSRSPGRHHAELRQQL